MRSVPTLIDTGPIVAVLNQRDAMHRDCVEAFQRVPAPLLTCWPVITEVAYLLGDYSPVTSQLFTLIRTRGLEILPIELSEIDIIESILAQYADQKFQLADATLMYLAERENVEQVLTLDRKDFGVFRTSTGRVLQVFP